MHTFDFYTNKIDFTQHEKEKLFMIDNYLLYFQKQQKAYPDLFKEFAKADDIYFVKDQYNKKTETKHNELEIKGYLEAWKYVMENYNSIVINRPTIILLHALIFRYTGNPLGGRLRKEDINVYVKDKNGTRLSADHPAPYQLVKPYLDNLLLAFNEGMEKNYNVKVVLIGHFIFDFLKIHPFRDGNGRLSRILLILLLLKNNIPLPRYVPFEKLKTSKYLGAIEQSQVGWLEGKQNPHFFIYAYLNYLIDCCKELDLRLSKKLNYQIDSFRHKFNYLFSIDDISQKAIKDELKELEKKVEYFTLIKKDKKTRDHLLSYNDTLDIKDVYFDVNKIKSDEIYISDDSVSHHNKDELDTYRKVKKYIIENYNDLEINKQTILKIHDMLVNKNKGFRTTASVVLLRKEGNKNVVLTKNMNQKYVEKAMEGLITEYHRAIKMKSNLFLLLAELILDLSYIHPFEDGNGRTMRLIELLILLRNGVDYVIYAPVDKYYKNILYMKLRISMINWMEGINNNSYYRYDFLKYLLDNAKIVEDRIKEYYSKKN